jgi:hypothetical protein
VSERWMLFGTLISIAVMLAVLAALVLSTPLCEA